MLTTVIPFRGNGKTRLPDAIRSETAVRMLSSVVAAAAPLGRVLVVTDDPAAVPAPAEHVPDPGTGQGAAVRAGLERVTGRALVVNADLPRATTAALERLAAAGLALVAATDGTTNALSLPDPAVFDDLYGAGSAARFLASAPYALVSIPELEHDVDTVEDLA